ncbi:MAG: transposase [Pseudomonadota bacterium]
MTDVVVGVDVWKDWLDAHRRVDGQNRRFANTKQGRQSLIRWACGARIAFEPSGPYHRVLERHLAAVGQDAVKINPLQVRRFAEAVGTRAKTDAIDGRLIAVMAVTLNLPATPPLGRTACLLKALQIARQGLVKDHTTAKNRAHAQECAFFKRQAAARLRHVEAQLKALDGEIDALIAADQSLASRRAVLLSIPGISTVTAAALLAEAPELGTLSGKVIASLAGLAPMTRQSGQRNGRAMIRGGRAHLRHALSMPDLVAARFSPDPKAVYNRLISAGKPPKGALTALMRKLLILANALLRDRRPYDRRPWA